MWVFQNDARLQHIPAYDVLEAEFGDWNNQQAFL